MNPWYAWRSSIGLASVCLALAGCGGSDVPDPDSDPNAATEAPGASAPAPGPELAAAPAEPAATEPAAGEAPGADPATPTAEPADGAQAAAADPSASATQETDAAADPARMKSSSATADMLSLGSKPAPTETTETAGTAPAGSSDPAAAMAMAMAGAAPGAAPGAAAEAAAAPGPLPVDPASAAAAGGEMPGYPGATEGDLGGDKGPADFHSPLGAVNAFLSALKAKSPERLAEATARRAVTEAVPKNQKLFQSILEQSMTEDDLSDLANKLEGFNVDSYNTPKSTGRFSIILGKPGKNGEYYRRTITTRHEKDGWKVVDISGMGKVEKPIMMRGRTMRRR